MKARERYRSLLDKYYRAYSYGKSTFQQLSRQLRMLNRHYAKYLNLCIACLFVTSMMYTRYIDTIIIHHTGETNVDISADQIDGYHTSIGWRCIGYHFVIRRNGDVERGRPLNDIGAHAKGRNKTSIGIALSGNTATEQQLNSLYLLLQALTSEFPISSIERHHEECPGKSVPVETYQKDFIPSS